MQELSHREIQLTELEILLEFDKLCRQNGLRYSLAGGTLLGAVRHKGFIPWDDDIDVCMPRPDYERLKELVKKNALSERYYVTTDSEKNAVYPFLKLQDRTVEIAEERFNEVQNLWVDIFPVDGLPSDERKLKKIYKKSSLYRKIIVFEKWKNLKAYGGKHNKFTAFFIKIFVKLYGVKRAVRNSIKLALQYDYETSDYVGVVTWGCYGIGERMLKKEYEQFVEMSFEGHQFRAMGCWDSYLHGIYGDYMQLPPAEKRVTHNIKAYRVAKDFDTV